MEDLMAKLQEVLDSKEGQEKLKQAAELLSGPDGRPDLGAIGSLLGQGGGGDPPGRGETAPDDASGMPSPELLRGLGQLLRQGGQENRNTALLRALRPHLREERRHRVDEALRLMQLAAVLPALRDSGLLGTLFGGD